MIAIKVARVNRSRITDMMVARQTVVSSVTTVGSTSAAAPVSNSAAHYSDNFWLSKEQFYDHLERISENEQSFKDIIADQESFSKNYDTKNTGADELYQFVLGITDKYNGFINQIILTDKAKGEKKLFEIVTVITSYNRPLSNLGITLDRAFQLNISKDKFIKTISSSPHHMKLLLDPERGIIRKIHNKFREVLM